MIERIAQKVYTIFVDEDPRFNIMRYMKKLFVTMGASLIVVTSVHGEPLKR